MGLVDCKYYVDAQPEAIGCHADPPRLLSVRAPNGPNMCEGSYVIVSAQRLNGEPVWLRSGTCPLAETPSKREAYPGVWLYTGSYGTWNIGGRMARERKFRCHAAFMFSRMRHGGRLPHQVAGSWWREDGGRFVRDPEISVVALEGDASTELVIEEVIPRRETELRRPIEVELAEPEKEPEAPVREDGAAVADAGRVGVQVDVEALESLDAEWECPPDETIGMSDRERKVTFSRNSAPVGVKVFPKRLQWRGEDVCSVTPEELQRPPERAAHKNKRRIGSAHTLVIGFFPSASHRRDVMECSFCARPLGVLFNQEQTPITVASVTFGGAAFNMRVRRGMQVATIDGMDVTKLPYAQAYRLLEDRYMMLPKSE